MSAYCIFSRTLHKILLFNARSRLWDLLSQERSIRFEVQNIVSAEQFEKTTADDHIKEEDKEKNINTYADVDCSPITSPENMKQTRFPIYEYLLM